MTSLLINANLRDTFNTYFGMIRLCQAQLLKSHFIG